jgi:hypothetical protein
MDSTQQDLKPLTLDTPDTGTQDSISTLGVAHSQTSKALTAAEGTSSRPNIGPSAFQSSDPALQEFIGFPKLPLELRRIIWGHSLPGPRVIEIFAEDNDNFILHNELITIRKDTHTAILAVLRTCKESEEIVLGAYEKIAASAWNLNLSPGAAILINYEQDIIHSAGRIKDIFFRDIPKQALENITVLGFGRSEFDTDLRGLLHFHESHLFHGVLPRMVRLEKIVLEDEDMCWDDWTMLQDDDDIRGPAPWGSAPFVFDGIEDKALTPAFVLTIERVRETAKDPLFGYLKGIEIAVAPYTRQIKPPPANGD